MPSEAGTCRTYVLPAIYAAGWIWIDDQIREQLTFTPGRIIVAGGKVKRGKSITSSPTNATVVEAKAEDHLPGGGRSKGGYPVSAHGPDPHEIAIAGGKESASRGTGTPAQGLDPAVGPAVPGRLTQSRPARISWIDIVAPQTCLSAAP